MLLAREFIDYISRQTIKKLSPQWLETTDPQVAADFMANIVEEDLAVEDQLNDEVRDLLSQYSDYMRKEGVSYQEMFRRIKNTLITQRKVIRAAGRDSGDSMKLSRDKINDLSHKVVAALRKSREIGRFGHIIHQHNGGCWVITQHLSRRCTLEIVTKTRIVALTERYQVTTTGCAVA